MPAFRLNPMTTHNVSVVAEVVRNELELYASIPPHRGSMRAHRGLIALLTGILVKLATKEPLDRIENELVSDLLTV